VSGGIERLGLGDIGHIASAPPAGQGFEGREPEAPEEQGVEEPRLHIVSFGEFVSVSEKSSRPLLGSPEENVLPAGGELLIFGEGGSSKTTLALDGVAHMAAGIEWLGLPVAEPVTVLVIENEGPRGPFREKLGRKAAAWDGPSFAERVHVFENPWGAFSFADEGLRAELAGAVKALGIELVVAGPLSRLGMAGGGTLAEVAAFEALLAALRAEVEAPLALWLVHHDNKAGGVSGAWEGAPDTLAHVKAEGKNRSILRWQKCRWAAALHGARWTLGWGPGESFELLEKDALPSAVQRVDEDAEARVWIAAYIARHYEENSAGIARGRVEDAFQEAHGKGRNLARRVITGELEKHKTLAGEGIRVALSGEGGELFAVGPGESPRGTYLYPASYADPPSADRLFGECREHSFSRTSLSLFADSPLRNEGAANGESANGPAEQEPARAELERELGAKAPTARAPLAQAAPAFEGSEPEGSA
jgi:hypothetical protein